MASPELPDFPEASLPHPEPQTKRLTVRLAAIAALLASAGYLTWRTFYTVDLGVWWVSVPFLILEFHAAFSLGLFTFSLWDIDVRPRLGAIHRHPGGPVAVLIPTLNESREILIPTIASAVAMELEHETWVLDDGDRPFVRELAQELGARYLARQEKGSAKAGNINHALGVIDADFVAILDADHVAHPSFLECTLGYFQDERIAVVQTPQDFYNLDSFEHEGAQASSNSHMYHEQQLFYRAIQPGKNRWDAAFWCGTGAVLRVAALHEVGGVATETFTEDIHTTIRLHRRGWKTVYHNQVLARGLAADTAHQFEIQRLRWGTGAMQVLKKENPLFVSGLTLGQRIAYGSTLLGWFEAWRSLGYILMPMIVLFTGAVPVRANPVTFGIAFGVTFIAQQIALRLLSRGYSRYLLAIIFELVRMTPNLLATLTLVWPGSRRFVVTPKGRESGEERTRLGPPPLLVGLVVANIAAAAWFVATVAGLTPTVYTQPWFAYVASIWLAFNLGLTLVAIGRVSSTIYGPERRSAVRFDVGLPATFDRQPCLIHEISLTGAQVSFASEDLPRLVDINRRHGFTIEVLKQSLSFDVYISWRRAGSDERVYWGLEFGPGQTPTQARLAMALLNRELTPTSQRPALAKAA